jgi:hypothetical protein
MLDWLVLTKAVSVGRGDESIEHPDNVVVRDIIVAVFVVGVPVGIILVDRIVGTIAVPRGRTKVFGGPVVLVS